LALLLASCADQTEHAVSIGEAFVGPIVLKIRKDIPLQSPVVATVRHGERLEILQQRRRFLRVRTPSGAEGWTDERQLLAAEDMQKLKDLSARAQTMPVQGQATSFGELNVHTQAARQSPSFLQIKENEKVDVLLHISTPRVELSRKPLIPPVPKKVKVKEEEKKAPKDSRYPPLTPPKPPGPPPNWLELSKTNLADDDDSSEQAEPPKEEPPAPQKPVATDDWSLVRTKAGESGWVLTRRLIMAIPDDVAQYAEGHRIVSYFSLGTVADGDEKKQNWLWTTIGDGSYPYDFDSFRVFIWSLRRHRYETAYIERNLRGYAPVLLRDVELSSTKTKGSAQAVKYPGFSICMEKKDGQRYRRDYAFITNVVRFAGEQPCEAAAPQDNVQSPAPLRVAAEPQPQQSLTRRARQRLRALAKSWFGK
jgi:hypothetical protein